MPDQPIVTTCQGRFRDRQGRQVLLHGINYVNKDPRTGYLFDEDGATFAAFRRWGFNCVRLGVIWDGLEPQPGVYNEAYLDGIARQLEWAHAAGLYVFLDMHQDLYSVLYADGAPAWATLHDGQPHVGGHAVWSDAYFASPAVQASLDNFWRNAPAADGIGLQDHLAACWRRLAARFGARRGEHPALIGYDLWNEPVPGSAAPEALALQFGAGARLLAGSGALAAVTPSGATPDEGATALLALWAMPEGRFQLLQVLADPQLYAAVVDASQPVYGRFEREALIPFQHRMAAAIRSIDPSGIIFLETSMGSNMGVYSAIEPLGGQADAPSTGGSPGAAVSRPPAQDAVDAQQAYAPHGYDLVVDTPNNALASPERVDLIFTRHAETAARRGWPMLAGEWGAYGFMPGTLAAARDVVRVFERLLASDTYWAYEPGIEEAPCFPALQRPYPERTAGNLEMYRYDAGSGVFECAWAEDEAIRAPSVIYLPAWFGYDPARLQIEPAGPVEVISQPDGAWLHIGPLDPPSRRTLKVCRTVGVHVPGTSQVPGT